MQSPRRIVLASGNAGKLAELTTLLAPYSLELHSQAEFGIEPPEETGTTFVDNALLKARNAAALTGLPALADDSGIAVDALDGRPGVWSARYAGLDATDADNNARLLEELAGVPAARRTARYHCVIVLVQSAEDPAPLIASATWEGAIGSAPRGSGGFGYDPLFVPAGDTRTAAEYPAAEKNRVSHRGQALVRLLALLQGLEP